MELQNVLTAAELNNPSQYNLAELCNIGGG